ncbi:MAG: ABC transporter permease [Anaerolineae bacterium]|nr:ABC transporter permease [Anaerolineae bacterium]
MIDTSLSQVSWHSYLAAILAIAKKDALHFIRYPMNAVFRIIQPLIWIAPVYFLSLTFVVDGSNTGFAGYTGTTDFVSFILLGSILSNYINAVFWGIGYSLREEMDSGVLESNWMAPMSRGLLLVGRTVASLVITTFTSVAMLVLARLLFGFRATGSVLAAFGTLVPMLVALYGFGFAFAALVLIVREPNMMVDVLSYLVSSMSGANFPVNVLPRFLLPISLAIPLTYGYDAVRSYVLGTRTLIPVHYEVIILVGFMIVMVPAGYAFFKLVERRCRQLGTLGFH